MGYVPAGACLNKKTLPPLSGRKRNRLVTTCSILMICVPVNAGNASFLTCPYGRSGMRLGSDVRNPANRSGLSPSPARFGFHHKIPTVFVSAFLYQFIIQAGAKSVNFSLLPPFLRFLLFFVTADGQLRLRLCRTQKQ
jgi:hypothetical protein